MKPFLIGSTYIYSCENVIIISELIHITEGVVSSIKGWVYAGKLIINQRALSSANGFVKDWETGKLLKTINMYIYIYTG